jgi:transcription elongation factor Elf1
MTWTTTPLHTFTCGACGTSVNAIASLKGVEAIMVAHAKVCPAVSPANETKP